MLIRLLLLLSLFFPLSFITDTASAQITTITVDPTLSSSRTATWTFTFTNRVRIDSDADTSTETASLLLSDFSNFGVATTVISDLVGAGENTTVGSNTYYEQAQVTTTLPADFNGSSGIGITARAGITFYELSSSAVATGDASDAALAGGLSLPSYTRDAENPIVQFVRRSDVDGDIAPVPPADTSADTVHFRVTFSEPVMEVDTGDFKAVFSALTNNAPPTATIGRTTVAPRGSSNRDYIVTVDLSSVSNSGNITLRVAQNRDTHLITDIAGNALERDNNQTLLGSGNVASPNIGHYVYSPPLRIASVTHPSGSAPLTLARARWVVEFNQAILIGPMNSVDADTGRILSGELSARANDLDANANARSFNFLEAGGERDWVIQRCAFSSAAAVNPCNAAGENTNSQDILGHNEFQVYTSDVETIGTDRYGTTFIFQVTNVGLTANQRLQLILREATAGHDFSVSNSAGTTFGLNDLATTGSFSRESIQAISPAGGTAAQTREATIIPDTTAPAVEFDGPSKVEYDSTTELVTATIKFTNLTADVTPEDFSLASSNFGNTRYGVGTQTRALDATDSTYIFTAPVAANSDVGSHNIELRWSPRPEVTHTSTFGTATGQTFTFTSGTAIASTTATLTAVTDSKAPSVSSVLRSDSSGSDGSVGSTSENFDNFGTIYYLVKFDEPVTAVDDGDFHAVRVSAPTVAVGNTTVTSKGGTDPNNEWIVAVDLSSNNTTIADDDDITLRVARTNHAIVDTATTPVAWAATVGQTLLPSDTEGETYKYIAPPSIVSVVHPANIEPLTFAAARWVVTFSEAVLIGTSGNVDDDTGNITGGIFSPGTGGVALDATDRAFILQRCDLTCPNTADGNGLNSLQSDDYQVYTTDLESDGSNRFGTTFVFQMRSLTGFPATNRFQLVVPDDFAVQNKALSTLRVGGLVAPGATPDTNPVVLSRRSIQTRTNIGGTDAEVRQATIVPLHSSVEHITNAGVETIRTRVYFTHNTTNISFSDFTIDSDVENTVFGISEEEEALNNDDTVYVFDTPILSNAQSDAQNIFVTWTPDSTTTRSSSHGSRAFTFTFAQDAEVVTDTPLLIPIVTDATNPTLSSFNADTSGTHTAQNRPVTWVITFSESVTGLDINDITVAGTLATDVSSLTAQSPTTIASTTYARVYHFTTTTNSGQGTITATINSGTQVSDTSGNTLSITTDNTESLDWSAFTSNITRIQRINTGGSTGTQFHGGNTDRDGDPSTDAFTRSTVGTLANPFKSNGAQTQFGLDIGYKDSPTTTRHSNGYTITAVEPNTSYRLGTHLLITCELVPVAGQASNKCTGNFTTSMRNTSATNHNGLVNHRLDSDEAFNSIPAGRIAKFTISTLYPNGVPFSNIGEQIDGQESNVFYYAVNSDANNPVTFPDPPTVTSSVSADGSGNHTITYTATYATTPAESLTEGFAYTERAADHAPDTATDSVNPSTYGLHFDCYIADCSGITLGTHSFSRSGNVDTIVANLTNVASTDILDVSLRTGMRAITEQITGAGATATVNPTTPVSVIFSNPVATNYDVSWTLTFDAIINLTTGTDENLFKIESPDGDATNLVLTDVTDGGNTTGKEYRISGFLPGTPGPGSNTSSVYTASFTPTAILQTASSNRRVPLASVTATQTQTIDYTNIPLPAITNIQLAGTSAVGDAQVNFEATFNYPVSGVETQHFAVLSSTFPNHPSSGTPTPTLNDPVGIAPSITSGGETYFTKWRIPTASVTIAADSSVVLRADIATDEVAQIVPLGTQSQVAVSDASTNPVSGGGILTVDIVDPEIDLVTRFDNSTGLTSGGTVIWNVTFDEGIDNVDLTGGTDFIVTIAGSTAPPPTPTVSHPSAFGSPLTNALRVEVDLPTTGFPTDTLVTLSLNTNTGITDDATTPNDLVIPANGVLVGAEPFTLNTDEDDIVLTIARVDPEEQDPRVDGTANEVRWTLTFNKDDGTAVPVEGVDVDADSQQFGITIGSEVNYEDSASPVVFVTGSGTTYTATVALPQSSYPSDIALNLTLVDIQDALSAISQVDNSHDKEIHLSTDTADPRTDLVAPSAVLTNDTNSYTVNTGTLTLDDITSINGTVARSAVFTVTFDARVSSFGQGNFSFTQADGTTASAVTATFASVGASPGRHAGQTGTDFAYTWQVTTIAVPVGESLRLTIDTTGLVAEGASTDITVPTGDDLYHNHQFIATNPMITDANASIVDATPTMGGDVSWEVTFNQAVVGVTADRFAVSHGSVTGISPSDSTQESRVWTVTATLPTSGQPTPENVILTLNPTSAIEGSVGPIAGSADGRLPYLGTDEVAFTAFYSYQTLEIMSVAFAASAHVDYEVPQLISYSSNITATNPDPANLPTNAMATPTQVPGLIRYIVTYNIAPPAPTADTYAITCSTCPATATAPDVVAFAAGEQADAGIPANSHLINVRAIPNVSAQGIITLVNGGTPLADVTTIADSDQAQTVFHVRPQVTYTIDTVKTATDAIIVLRFSEAVNGFSEGDLTIAATAAAGATADFTFDASRAPIYTYTTALTNISTGTSNAGTDVTATLMDATPFITATSDSARVFNPVLVIGISFPLPVTLAVTENINDFATEATAPLVERVSIANLDTSAVSGVISWDITFDQAVTGVLASHFDLVATIATPDSTNPADDRAIDAIDAIVPVIDQSAGTTFRLTATIPPTMIDVITSLSLSLDTTPTTTAGDILGASGTTSDTNTDLTNLNLVPADTNHDLAAFSSSSSSTRAEYSILNDARLLSLSGGMINQGAGTQTFTATFSREVMGLELTNFAMVPVTTSTSGTLTTELTRITPDDTMATTTTYTITTTTTGDAAGRIGATVTLTLEDLDNVAVATSSTGAVTALPTTPATAFTQSFQDTQPPEITGVVRLDTFDRITDPTATPTVRWTVTFNEPVTGFDATDIAASGRAAITDVSPDASTIAARIFTVTASVSGLTSPTGDTEIGLAIVLGDRGILDTSTTNSAAPNGNPFAELSGAAAIITTSVPITPQHYILNTDTTAPTFTSISRVSTVNQYTSGGTATASAVSWTVRFSELVRNVESSHFAVMGPTGTSNVTIAPITSTTLASEYVVTVALPASGNNDSVDVHLAMDSTAVAILDGNGNALTLPSPLQLTDATSRYILDNQPPSLVSLSFAPVSGTRNLTWTATFNEPVMGLGASSFTLTPSNGNSASGFTPTSPTAGASTVWTFTTTQTGQRFSGMTMVTEKEQDTGITNASGFPALVADSNSLKSGSHTFNSSTSISGITNTFAPTHATRDGSTQAMSVGNLESVTWTITYNEPIIAPSITTYAVNCSCSETISVASATATSTTVHTVMVTTIPSFVGNLTLTNGMDAFVPITTGQTVIHIDTVAPGLDDNFGTNGVSDPVTSGGTITWTVTFTEAVERFDANNVEIEGSDATPTFTGSGDTWMVMITAPPDDSIGLSIVPSPTASEVTIDLAGNALIAGIRLSVRRGVAEDVIAELVTASAVQYISSTPSLAARFARLPSGGGVSSSGDGVLNDTRTNFSANVTNDSMNMNFDMKVGNHSFASTMNDTGKVLEYNGVFSLGSGLFGIEDWWYILPEADAFDDFEMWVQTTYSTTENKDTSTDSETMLVHVGIDTQLSDGGILGALIQFDFTDYVGQATMPTVENPVLDSFGFMVGPYYSNRFDGIDFESRLAIGGSTVEFNPFGSYVDEYDTSRVFASASLSQDLVNLRNDWILSPTLEYSFYMEEQDEYMDSATNPGLIGGSQYSLSRFSFGPELSRRIVTSEGGLIIPSLALSGIFDNTETINTSGRVVDNISSGKLDFGLSYRADDGFSWNFGGYYDIITESDTTSFGMTSGLGIRF